MGRPRTGSVHRANGKVYARVTWIDQHGQRRDAKRPAMDDTHARALLPEMLAQVGRYCRVQPHRPKKYKRHNLSIYCIQILDSALCPIKIGTSANIPMRMKMILTHQPHDIRLLATWPGTVKDEKAIHQMFSAAHLAREWFRPTVELMAYIEEKRQKEAA